MGRMGRAEEVAKAVGYLCSTGADYVTGCVLQVDGGMYMGKNHESCSSDRDGYHLPPGE